MHEEGLGQCRIARNALRLQRIDRLDKTGLAIDEQGVWHHGLERREQHDRERQHDRNAGRDAGNDPRDPPRGAQRLLLVLRPAGGFAIIGFAFGLAILLHARASLVLALRETWRTVLRRCDCPRGVIAGDASGRVTA